MEKYLEEQDLPYTVFQPQYIYGPYTAKDCEQWFIDRVIRCSAAFRRSFSRLIRLMVVCAM